MLVGKDDKENASSKSCETRVVSKLKQYTISMQITLKANACIEQLLRSVEATRNWNHIQARLDWVAIRRCNMAWLELFDLDNCCK
jgi:hypothetical protein